MKEFTLPLQDPVLVFSFFVLIIFFIPLVFRWLKIPEIIGLILAGTLFGPHGLNVLSENIGNTLFGTVGLLYIMFLAGLDIDVHEVKKNRKSIMVFFLLSFLISQIGGMLGARFILHLSWISSILLGSMFASHTLITYPIVSKYGINKNEAITIAVGGTILVNFVALLILGIIAGSAEGNLNYLFWIKLILSLGIFVFIVLAVLSRVAKWFFRHGSPDGVNQYVFVLSIMFISAFLARLAGLEPVLGAFLGGMSLNKYIPFTSPLMNRTEFIGNTLFIPFFLVSVGMLVDFSVFTHGSNGLLVAGTMVVIANSGKWLSSFITQKWLGYSRDERRIIFGLSNAQAASTLAAVIVGYKLNLLNLEVVNGTIVMILVTCMVSSFITESAAKKLVHSVILKSKDEPEHKLLVPVSNPENIENLIDLALLLKNPVGQEPVYVLSVLPDTQDAVSKIEQNNRKIQKIVRYVSATENKVYYTSRIDNDAPDGIVKSCKELGINGLIAGWNGSIPEGKGYFGVLLDKIIETTRTMIVISKFTQPIQTIEKVYVFAASKSELELGAKLWMASIYNMARQTGRSIHFYGSVNGYDELLNTQKFVKPSIDIQHRIFENWEDFNPQEYIIGPHDLLVIIASRINGPSFQRALLKIPQKIVTHIPKTSSLFIFPHQ